MFRLFVIVFFVVALFSNFLARNNQHSSYLAKSFIQGKTYFIDKPERTWSDTVLFEGKYYWPQGPFPTVVLVPFVFVWQVFGQFFYQGPLNYFFVLATFYLVFKISRKYNFAVNDSFFLASAFCIGSTYLAVAMFPVGWYFAQNVTVLFLLMAIYEYLDRKRYWLIGIIFGCVLATRVTAGLGIIFFVMEVIFANDESKRKFSKIVQLLAPMLLSSILLGYYNFLRFGNFLESGYNFQLLNNPALLKNRSYGLFSLWHLPENLYRLLLAGPQPVVIDDGSQVLRYPFIKTDNWGMNIFLTSPYLVYLFFLKYRDRISKFLIVTTITVAIPIVTYYGIGISQFGYRYSLDFFPFIFLLLIRTYRQQFGNLSTRFKIIIVFSTVFNLYLFYTWMYFHYA